MYSSLGPLAWLKIIFCSAVSSVVRHAYKTMLLASVFERFIQPEQLTQSVHLHLRMQKFEFVGEELWLTWTAYPAWACILIPKHRDRHWSWQWLNERTNELTSMPLMRATDLPYQKNVRGALHRPSWSQECWSQDRRNRLTKFSNLPYLSSVAIHISSISSQSAWQWSQSHCQTIRLCT